MTLVWVMVCAMAVPAGLVGVVAGLVGTQQPPSVGWWRRWRADRVASLPAGEQRKRRSRWIAAAVLGVAVWLVSGVFAVAALLAVAVVGVPWLLSPTRYAGTRIKQLEGLGEWCQRCANALQLGMGLEQALASTRKNPPKGLEDQITDLADRLQVGWRPQEALRQFAAEVNDVTADKVAAALLLSAASRGPGLARSLEDMAESVREEVARRRTIEADRAKPRTTVRWMTIMTLGIVAAGFLVPDYTAPYGSVLGQLVLAGLGGGFVAVLVWMRSLADHRPVPRFLVADPRSRVRQMSTTGAVDAVGARVR
ncbi:type II secretion system F family protein [Streptomyces noursei]|uniref:type II secretion system F family protein n=1 Tax=Streptomyces noursei TaxID=1971 RepID=UPI00081CC5A9|nr:integral membrane protein [Streptomyces noursei ATCC 11455]ANZ21939.1 integral membrane protein [Streptomyces noursei ATCC 11455]MCZ0996534.1 type II secretion system F family protein [Streptomyces noursei]